MKQIQKKIEAGNSKLTKLQEAIEELLSATSVPEEELEAVPFAEMTFSFQGSKEPLTVKDLINMTLSRLDREISIPIPMLKREEWQKERNANAKEIVTTLQSQLLSVSKLHKKKINDVGKKMYLDVKQKIALAAKTDKENMALRQRISELDERAVAREKAKTQAAEQIAREQTMRAEKAEKHAEESVNRLSMMERFISQAGVTEAFANWSSLYCLVEEAAKALVNWARSKKLVFTNKDERTISQGIVAKCQLEGLNPFDDNDRQKAAKGIADIADSVVGEIGQYKWNIALRRLYQLTSEMRMSVGDNGNTISFIIGGSKSKQGLG